MYQCFLSILIIQRLRTPLEAQGTTQRCGYAAMLAAQDMHHGPLIRQSQNQESTIDTQDRTEERDIFTNILGTSEHIHLHINMFVDIKYLIAYSPCRERTYRQQTEIPGLHQKKCVISCSQQKDLNNKQLSSPIK